MGWTQSKQGYSVLISSIYRSPSGYVEFISKLSDIIDRTSCECEEIIVTGDFNCDVSEDDKGEPSIVLFALVPNDATYT